MKKVILILAVIALSFSCNKNKKTLTPQNDVYCVWIKNSNGTKTFYRCVETSQEMANVAVDLRNQNKFYEETRKATCSDCN